MGVIFTRKGNYNHAKYHSPTKTGKEGRGKKAREGRRKGEREGGKEEGRRGKGREGRGYARQCRSLTRVNDDGKCLRFMEYFHFCPFVGRAFF